MVKKSSNKKGLITKKAEKLNKKKKIRTTLLSVLIIFILAISMFGVALQNIDGNTVQNVELEGFTFAKKIYEEQYIWQITKTPKGKELFQDLVFYASPYEINESMEKIPQSLLNSMKTKEGVFLAINPSSLNFNSSTISRDVSVIRLQESSRFEISNVLSKLNINSQNVLSAEFDDLNQPVISCKDMNNTLIINYLDVSLENLSSSKEIGFEEVEDNLECFNLVTNELTDIVMYTDALKFALIK